MGRPALLTASLLLVGAVAWPAVHPDPLDSFPVTDYTMFAHRRPAVSRFDIAVLVDADGVEHALDPAAVGGTDQPVQAVETVLQAIRTGRTHELCAEIAAGVERPGTIEVVSVRYDAPAWFRGDREPRERTVHAACPTRGAP